MKELIRINEQYSQKFAEICRPAYSYFGITDIFLISVDYDGYGFFSSTDHEKFITYVKQKKYINDPFICHPSKVDSGTYLCLADANKNSTNNIASVEQDIGVIEKDDNGYIYLIFRGKGTNVINKVINETTLVRKFISHIEFSFASVLAILAQNKVNLFQLKGSEFNVAHEMLSKVDIKQRVQFLITIGKLTEADVFLQNVFLTLRERQCALLCLKGFTNKEVADILGIKRGTVGGYIKSLMQKLKVSNRATLLMMLAKLEDIGFFMFEPQVSKKTNFCNKPGSYTFKHFPKQLRTKY